jgi:ClpP class serine protease
MSAATMVACAANQIVMGKHSFLGPIDPQLILQTALGNRLVPVQNILEQFERALRDGADPVKLRVWAPMLTQYGPDLLVTCQNLVHGG